MSKKVSDILPKTEILAQLAEEAPEPEQAALKLPAALDGTSPAPESVVECEVNIMEKVADSKYFRWLSRLGTKEQSDE